MKMNKMAGLQVLGYCRKRFHGTVSSRPVTCSHVLPILIHGLVSALEKTQQAGAKTCHHAEAWNDSIQIKSHNQSARCDVLAGKLLPVKKGNAGP